MVIIIMPWQLRSIADCLDRSFFSKDEKVDYIDAVLCLQSTPSRTPADLVPGARSRYDDFVATHINQTLQIHYTVWSYSHLFWPTPNNADDNKGTFLTWHRWFIWEFEQALRNECGYKGTLP